MRTHRVVTCLLFLSLAGLSGPAAAQSAAAEFEALLGDHWAWRLETDPVFASRQGDHRYDDRLRDLSLEAFEERHDARLEFLRRLRQIDPGALSDSDRINYDLFRRELDDEVEEYRFRGYLMPVSQRGGPQFLHSTSDLLRLESAADYDAWLARMAAVPEYLDQVMALQEAGRRSGHMPPRVLMERVPAQIELQLVENGEDSPYFQAFEAMPDTLSAAEQDRLRARAIDTIEDRIVPAYRAFKRYFESRYLPDTRETVGASELPDGEAFYAFRARRYTTTRMTPEEIHRLGLREVARIRADMLEVIDEVGFDGSFDEFLHFLRTDPQFYYETPEELFNAYLAICKRIDPELVRLFGRLPRIPYGLRPVPDDIAPDTTTAYYWQPAGDGSRPGYYYVNLYRPEVRPKYEMEVLSVHEAVPGHHLQLALQLELDNLPDFRRHLDGTVFVEGWGLYSESLGYDLGLYKDPYSRFGALTYEMWRAVRLVVDTGIHALGWSRDQAIAFFRDNTAKTETDIVNEIDRYIAWPGQALAYKIGQMKILELRQNAEQTLGRHFDIRAFHDALLGSGALPLDMLETRMNRWMADQLAAVNDAAASRD